MNQRVDYFIVGLGLAGSTLAWELVQRGKTVMVFDAPADNHASAVAAGLFNPITGKVMTKAWKADILFPFLKNFYSSAEKILKRNFFHLSPMYRPFISTDERKLWKQKSETDELKDFVSEFREVSFFEHQVNNPFGGIGIAHAGYLQVGLWIAAIRDFLRSQNSYQECLFNDQELLFDGAVTYQEWAADKIIFCNGLGSLQSRWFEKLPIIPLKGEVLTVKINQVLDRIYNRGVFIVPSVEANVYRVGSTYEHKPFLEGPSTGARESLESKLHELIPSPFEIVHQEWGIRPTSPDRRPMLGAHPDNKNVVIFNGLGTKGVSLAPYFAHHLADWLEGVDDLSTEVNIYRFKALYSK